MLKQRSRTIMEEVQNPNRRAGTYVFLNVFSSPVFAIPKTASPGTPISTAHVHPGWINAVLFIHFWDSTEIEEHDMQPRGHRGSQRSLRHRFRRGGTNLSSGKSVASWVSSGSSSGCHGHERLCSPGEPSSDLLSLLWAIPWP